MAITENQIIGKIEVTEMGHVQVRRDTIIKRDGEEISREYHRWVISPGDDYSNEDAQVKAVCKAVHTAAVIKAYKNMLTAQE